MVASAEVNIVFFHIYIYKFNMFEKLEELAKNNKKISDFHIRSGSPLAYRQTGEIIMVKDVMVKPQDLIDLMTTNCNEHETKKFQ